MSSNIANPLETEEYLLLKRGGFARDCPRMEETSLLYRMHRIVVRSRKVQGLAVVPTVY